ncbi:MAG: VWA domain-containing protein [Myxococcales bacterium]
MGRNERKSGVAAASLGGLSLALLGLGLLGCGGSEGSKGKPLPCLRGDLEGCYEKCDTTADCGSGLTCQQDGLKRQCLAYCTAESASTDCGPNSSCSALGQCEKGSLDGGSSDGDGGKPGGGGCGKVDVAAHPQTPNVILIVDQSSSMAEDLGGVSRWQALKNVLLANDGLIADLQSKVRFGLFLYSSKNHEIACPALTSVSAKLDNLAAIRDVYLPADMIEDTPTGDAVTAITDMVTNQFVDMGVSDETIFILATDGEPDTCAQPDPQNGQQQAIAAVKRAFDMDIKTYVIAVSKDNQEGISSGHAQALASAGVGGASSAKFYRVSNVTELESSLREIVEGQLDCVQKLNGTFPDEVKTACDADGTVSVSGKALMCDADWVIVNPSTIEIKGEACDRVKADNASISAQFACGVIDLF